MHALVDTAVFRLMLELCLKASGLVLLAGFAVWSLRQSSAALRHHVLRLALVGLILLPIASLLLPAWQAGSAAQSESAQSIRRSLSLSMPSLQSSTAGWQPGSLEQSRSKQSVRPSPSLS